MNKYIDRTRYIPNFVSNSTGKIESYLFDWGYVSVNLTWSKVCEEFAELLEQYPNAVNEDEIKKHLERAYKLASRHQSDINQYYHYCKTQGPGFCGESRDITVTGINIQSFVDFDRSLVPVLLIENETAKEGNNARYIYRQMQITSYYDTRHGLLIPHSIKGVDVEGENQLGINIPPKRLGLLQPVRVSRVNR